ncbi:GH92 family glycosyl hydrolase [Chitinophaga rhizophila]|uniref:Glycoside hydrolase family 92 protein n=1 Tax=Chitinophaga rhizophila TaxID=2866212 RepID=A0ABS7G958_9BACT|nr:GH92 family glycosyl hydrolase [Chitinophaga rhizophila]MBW8684184.1 glycoside hydrolase family 92 protein [Chitinophaga rhizophila]
MKRNRYLISTAMLLGIVTTGVAQQQAPTASGNANLEFIDPTIGSVGLILEPTRPAMYLPNSMVRVFPSRKDQLDDQIGYFPLTIASHRQQSLFGFIPVSGELTSDNWQRGLTYDQEAVKPYAYKVYLEDVDTLQFSPSERSGYFSVGFSGNKPHFLRLSVLNNNGELHTQGKRVISGKETFNGMSAFFYAELNADIISTEYRGDKKQHMFVALGNKSQRVDVRYGVSFISVEKAKANLQREINVWNIKPVRDRAYEAWQRVIGGINVKGGTEAQKRVFYTSLYRSYERMVDINEYGQYYSAYDHKVHNSGSPFYVDNWLWDTYIALEPLQTLLNPDAQVHKINSYIAMYEQSGWMPSFAVAHGDMPCMTGNHAAAWIADAWFKGVRGFDLAKAYEGLKKNSLQATLLPWRNGPATSLDSFYNKHGYMPALKPGEKETVKEVHDFERRQAVAVTLENSYDDWCIAQLAKAAGHPEDVPLFLKRAANYKNVFRADKGFMWPKDAEGKWIEPFDPKFSGGQGGRDYFTENNAYTYNWDVKHDLQGLFELMGGRAKAEEKLDNLFRENLGRSKYQLWYTFPDATGLVGQFVMGNEPSFHIPYLYNYTGAPWKTQKRIRMLLDTWYTDNLFGIPGDEDGGGMTAYVVFSMMGFCPVTPGIPVYNIGSPVFEEISIKLANGKTFTVSAPGSSGTNKYIQSAMLNGQTLNKPWFTHDELMQGGVLKLVMGEQPNKQWGADEKASPVSAIGN